MNKREDRSRWRGRSAGASRAHPHRRGRCRRVLSRNGVAPAGLLRVARPGERREARALRPPATVQGRVEGARDRGGRALPGGRVVRRERDRTGPGRRCPRRRPRRSDGVTRLGAGAALRQAAARHRVTGAAVDGARGRRCGRPLSALLRRQRPSARPAGGRPPGRRGRGGRDRHGGGGHGATTGLRGDRRRGG